MIIVNISIDSLGLINKYTVEGHANSAPYGEDIVCAAVSVLAQTALISLNEVCGINEKEIDFSIDEEIGYLEVTLPKKIDTKTMDKAQIVLRTFETGIKSIMESYPKYITLKYREV